MLTQRERVLCAMNQEGPDRVPIFGASSPPTMLSTAYENLKACLGISHPSRLLSRTFQCAQLDEQVVVRCGFDGRLIPPVTPRRTSGR